MLICDENLFFCHTVVTIIHIVSGLDSFVFDKMFAIECNISFSRAIEKQTERATLNLTFTDRHD